MRIGVNCCNIDPDYVGGVNTYTFGLLKGFSVTQKEHQFVIFCISSNEHHFQSFKQFPNFQIHVLKDISLFKKKILGKFVKNQWMNGYEIVSNIFYSFISSYIDKRCDVVYFPHTTITPFNYKQPTVLSMHDIQQVHFPQFFSEYELSSRKITYTLSAKNVRCMQASSKHMKKDFLEYFSFLKDNNVYTINEGVNISQFQLKRDTKYVLSKYNIPDKFLFFPAQLWPHKNHITVLKSLLKLEQEHTLSIPLVLTGAKYSSAESILDFISANKMTKVYYLGKIPFEDILSLYQQARFLITAVLYESSSLPILEAAAAGTPVIASKTPPNVELSERLKINLFSPLDSEELANTLFRVWNNEEVIKNQVEHNWEAIEYYSWENVARQYILLFEKIQSNATGKRFYRSN